MTLKQVLLSVVVSVVVVAGARFIFPQAFPLGGASGTEHYNQENFYSGMTIGGVNNTAVTSRSCATATIATTTSLGTGAVTSTDIALTGSVLGDLCHGSLTTGNTTTALISCQVTANGTGTLFVYGRATTTLSAGTGKVCFTH